MNWELILLLLLDQLTEVLLLLLWVHGLHILEQPLDQLIMLLLLVKSSACVWIGHILNLLLLDDFLLFFLFFLHLLFSSKSVEQS
jgi:hypothetical protein